MAEPRLNSIRGREVVLTGRFALGTQADLEGRARRLGARINHKRVGPSTDILVIGSRSGHWKHYTHGDKIDDAIRRRRAGQKIYMITAGELYQLLRGEGLTDRQSVAALSDDPTPAGLPYREALAPSTKKGTLTVDLDKIDRSTRAHQEMCNRLARAVKDAGLDPLSPFSDGLAYDLAWMRDERLWVVEVKSISGKSERQQIRLGLGQVIDYRTSLRKLGFDVQSVVAVTGMPSNPHFEEMCDQAEVILCSPKSFRTALSLEL